VNGALSANFGHLGYSTPGSSTTSVGIEPAFDYFVARNISWGGSVFVRYSDVTSLGNETKDLSFGITGQVGSNLWLTRRLLSVWPRLFVGALENRLTYLVSSDGSSTNTTEKIAFVELYVPLLLHLAPHVFVGFGPEAFADAYHTVGETSNLRRFWGAESIVGGWF